MSARRRTYGLSFSWKRALGVSAAKGRLSRKIGIPLTKSGRERKAGRAIGPLLLIAFAAGVAVASKSNSGNEASEPNPSYAASPTMSEPKETLLAAEKLPVISVPTAPTAQPLVLNPLTPQEQTLVPRGSEKPSFDCTKAKTAAARLICADGELARLDGELGAAYRTRMGQFSATDQKDFAAAQLAWIRDRNEHCGLVGKNSAAIEVLASSKPCMVSEIQERIAFLASTTATIALVPAQQQAINSSQHAVPPKAVVANDTATAAALKKAEDAMGRDNGAAYVTLLALANQGNAQAEVDLGTMLSEDYSNIPADYATAMTLFRRAADQGDIAGEDNLALMYMDGKGVPKDYATAAAWYLKAAFGGDPVASPPAQTLLGQIYEKGGYGVTQDYVQAYKWFDIAAEHKSFDVAQNGCPTTPTPDLTCPASIQRDTVAAKMSQQQIDQARRLSRSDDGQQPEPMSKPAASQIGQQPLSTAPSLQLSQQKNAESEGDPQLTADFANCDQRAAQQTAVASAQQPLDPNHLLNPLLLLNDLGARRQQEADQPRRLAVIEQQRQQCHQNAEAAAAQRDEMFKAQTRDEMNGYRPIALQNLILDHTELEENHAKLSIRGTYVPTEENDGFLFADARSAMIALSSPEMANSQQKIAILSDDASRNLRQYILECRGNPISNYAGCSIVVLGYATTCQATNAFGVQRTLACFQAEDGRAN